MSGPKRSFLKQTVDFALMGAANRIVEGALGVAAGEKVVLVVDTARQALGEALAAAVSGTGGLPTLVLLEDLGARPLTEVTPALDAALGAAHASVLLMGTEHPEEAGLRKGIVERVEKLGLRHAHMVGLSRRTFVSAFHADPARVADMVRAVRLKVLGRTELEYRSPAGTELVVRMPEDARWVEQGELIRPGRWANLPGGQLIALPESVDGVYVANASMNLGFGGSSSLHGRHLRLTIEGGVVRGVDSEEAGLAAAVSAHLASVEHLDRVGQIELGANPGLHEATGEPMLDQCVPGLHLVLGWTNPRVTGAGWCSTGILAVNSAEGDLDVDGVALLRGGRYVL